MQYFLRGWIIIFSVVIMTGFGPMPVKADLIGISFYGDDLIRIDESDASISKIGDIGAYMMPYGLGDYDGSLYTYDQEMQRVRQISTTDASIVQSWDIGLSLSGTAGEGGITFDQTGRGYLTGVSGENGWLYSFDIWGDTPSATLVSDSLGGFDGLDFNDSGVLYGKRHGSGDIYTINPITGDTTFVEFGKDAYDFISAGVVSGLTFDSSGKMFYEHDDYLYVDGVSVGLLGSMISGLCAIGEPSMPPAVPEPSTLILFGIGLLGVAGLGRKKQ